MLPLLTSLAQQSFIAASRIAKRKFDLETHLAGPINRMTLRSILDRHKDTEFGRRHHFALLRKARDYTSAVPLATYDDFRADIERMARGELNVLTRDRPVAFALSSGTTGTQKLVPVTDYTNRILFELFLVSRGALIETVPAARHAGFGLVLMSSVLTGKTEGGYPTGSFTALLMNRSLARTRLPLATPKEVLFVPHAASALHLQILFGLLDRDLGYIASTFTSGLLDFFQRLEQRGEALVRDIASGSLSPDLELPEGLAAPIRAALRKDPARARDVERELARGPQGLARRLWPKFAYASAVTSGSFSVYADKLRPYLGQVPLYSPTYVASEATLGINDSLGEAVYLLLLRAAFYEFIPAAELDEAHPTTLGIDEIQPGGRYEIVLTTYGGLYRYRLGDVIEVVRLQNRAPVVRFIHRRGSLLNIVGEKTSEHAAQLAVREAASAEGLDLVDFTTMEDSASTPMRYVFFLELGPGGAPFDVTDVTDVTRLSARLEDSLGRANPRLVTIRSRLGPLMLHLVKPGTFAELRERLIARGASTTQVKIPRVLPEGPLADLMLSRRL